MQNWLLIILFFVSATVYTFSQSYNYEERDGKIFIVHVVEGGNTLYSLKSQYDVEIAEIIQFNPSVQEGLQIGQRIFIPTELTSIPGQLAQKEHVVQKQETLFGISRQYDCSVDDLLEANPEAIDGIKVGQTLLIPSKARDIATKKVAPHSPAAESSNNYFVSEEDSTVQYIVQSKETLYSISKRFMVPIETLISENNIRNNRISFGDTLIIPIKRENTSIIEVKELNQVEGRIFLPTEDSIEKNEYIISFLLPFKIDANPIVVSELYDDNTRLNSVSEIALDFWLGAKKALDSLQRMGLRAKIHVFDTNGDLEKTKALLNKPEVLNSDLIFGPFFPAPIEYAANWAKEHRKFMVIPVAANANILEDNPFIHIMVPSELTLIGGMAKFLAANHIDDKIILINGRSEEEKKRIAFFETIFRQYKGELFADKQLIKMDVGGTNGRDLANQFDLSGKTIFICLADDAQGVMRFVNALNSAKNISSRHGEAKLIVVGMRSWHNISALNSYYKNRFNFTSAMPNFLDYSETNTEQFTLKFREEFKSDPSRFTFQGFDVVFFKISEKILHGMPQVGYMNKFQIQSLGERDGKENSTAFIVQQKEFELKLLGISQNASFLSKQTAEKQEEQEEEQDNEGDN